MRAAVSINPGQIKHPSKHCAVRNPQRHGERRRLVLTRPIGQVKRNHPLQGLASTLTEQQPRPGIGRQDSASH